MGQPIPRRNLISWPLSPSSVFLENNFVPLVIPAPHSLPPAPHHDHMKRQSLLSVSLLTLSSFQLASNLGPSISSFQFNASQGVWEGGKPGPQLQVSSTNDDIADRSWMPCISQEYVLFTLQSSAKRSIRFAEKLLKEIVELPETEEVNKESGSLVKRS